MDVYGLDISFQQGLQMLEKLLKMDIRAIELLYLMRAEQQGIEAAELLRRELEYVDPQIVLSLATGKPLPQREKCFQIERKGQTLSL